ncbi:COQ9 family protein [Ehrlichia ruminantium]|uniref:COQ9 family protein n=1 Tax=Ehrlichia ruminantium TaxID=779 RepID=UPI0015DCA1E7|nr:COQ9 family protein [Ehrlichia ruminantium]QLK50235.1 COQ9 family protein [Ehrlichia ruminantium]QLK51160.1 COQ9 family protein [Ehrlichia ruminantium]QLK52994.1 COQ9 family protein [Ehrlichia ruminantium]QLK58496.1 COQ9 family protein [Ehrlichia ruminantium]
MDSRSTIIKATIALIPFYGVSDETLLKACIDLNLYEDFCKFHDGIYDILNHINDDLINFITIKFNETDNINNFKVREKIQYAVQLCLIYYSSLSNYRELLKNILSATPYNMCFSITSLYKITDAIWNLAGDTSTDFNYYTKRTTLAAIYVSTLMYFINDFSENHNYTTLFLERRINNIIQIHNAKSLIADKLEKFNIFKVKFND